MPRSAPPLVSAVAVATASVLLAAFGPPVPAAAVPTSPVVYRPPVDAPVVDRFRPPAHVGGAGNAGIDYATGPGTPVRAAGPGTVVFAGSVAGGRHVVVLHADGVRTTYAFLAAVSVARGRVVAAGDVVGTAGDRLHFGARAGNEAYLDPLVLLAGGALALRLVVDSTVSPDTERGERNRLVRLLRGVPRVLGAVGTATLEWAGDTLASAADPARLAHLALATAREAAASALHVPATALDVAVGAAGALDRWRQQRGRCTPAGLVPPRPGRRRMVVLVAGLGSTSEEAGAFRVRTRELGYADDDVFRFSYRAATTTERAYGARDSTGGIAAAGERLRAVLEDLSARHPGVPIDVVAHSQGGLVARSALGSTAPPGVATLVTLATPHRGSDLASLGRELFAGPVGRVARGVVDAVTPRGTVKLGSTAVAELAEGSTFLRDLNRRPLPPGVRVTSVAARFDVVVTSPKARLRGAGNVVVDIPQAMQHAALPGSRAATREIALAVAGLDPTCQGFGDAMADEAVGLGLTEAFDLAERVASRAWPGPPPDAGRDRARGRLSDHPPGPSPRPAP